MPNGIAYAALFLWPLFAILAFRRLGVASGVLWALLGGYMFLPIGVGLDAPLLPSFNGSLSAIIAALIIAATAGAGRSHTQTMGWLPRHGGVRVVMAVLVASPLITALLNPDPLVFPSGRVIPGQTLYEGLSALQGQIVMLAPMLLARRYLSGEDGPRLVLRTLAVAGLIYTLPILFELWMSPQLHRIVYGFHQHQFIQMVRAGGYRPAVFLSHPLVVAVFMLLCALAMAAIWRSLHTRSVQPVARRSAARATPHERRAPVARPDWLNRQVAGLGLLWLIVIVILCKSLGAAALLVAAMPVALLFSARAQIWAAALAAGLLLSYPLLSHLDIAPGELIHGIVEDFSADRAGSFGMRLENEERLLDKAMERPLFGWGIWGRSRVYDAWSGADISVTDGIWAIQIGTAGFVGYLSLFGLMAAPIFILLRRRNRFVGDTLTATLTLMLAVNMLDMIPNSSLTPITWILSGVLLGRAERAGAPEPGRETAPERSARRAQRKRRELRSADAPTPSRPREGAVKPRAPGDFGAAGGSNAPRAPTPLPRRPRS